MNTLIRKTSWALVIIIITIPPLLMGGYYVLALETLLALASAYEIACLGNKNYVVLNISVNFLSNDGDRRILIPLFLVCTNYPELYH